MLFLRTREWNDARVVSEQGSQRLFVALELPPSAHAPIAGVLERLMGTGAEVRWVAPERCHVTLKFIGELAAGRARAVRAALARLAWPGPIQIRLAGLGRFPPRGAMRVIWVGIAGDLAALSSMAGRIETALVPLGIPAEGRAFAPHLTLGRIHGSRNLRTLEAMVASEVDFAVDLPPITTVSLFSSELHRDGARYRVLDDHTLR